MFYFQEKGLRSPAPLIVQNTNFFLQIQVDGSPKRSRLTTGGGFKKNSHLNHVTGRVCVPSNLDLRRLARDLLDGAHEDVRDDRDAKKAGNVSFSSRFSFYTDVLMQNRYFAYWIYKTWIILIFQLYWICIYSIYISPKNWESRQNSK